MGQRKTEKKRHRDEENSKRNYLFVLKKSVQVTRLELMNVTRRGRQWPRILPQDTARKKHESVLQDEVSSLFYLLILATKSKTEM